MQTFIQIYHHCWVLVHPKILCQLCRKMCISINLYVLICKGVYVNIFRLDYFICQSAGQIILMEFLYYNNAREASCNFNKITISECSFHTYFSTLLLVGAGSKHCERASAELNTGCRRYTMGGGGEVVVVNEQKASFQNRKPKVR